MLEWKKPEWEGCYHEYVIAVFLVFRVRVLAPDEVPSRISPHGAAVDASFP
jgi:hypothetical protein